jgi:hypothetical protein
LKPNNIIHPARFKVSGFGNSCIWRVMMSVGQIRPCPEAGVQNSRRVVAKACDYHNSREHQVHHQPDASLTFLGNAVLA